MKLPVALVVNICAVTVVTLAVAIGARVIVVVVSLAVADVWAPVGVGKSSCSVSHS